MFKRLLNDKGFTLLEVILAIVAMTIIATVAGFGLVEITKGYLFNKKNTITAQQGQIAMSRLKKEFSSTKWVSGAPTATSITFTRINTDMSTSTHTISWAGGTSPVLFDTDVVIQPVTLFNMSYYDSFSSAASAYSPTTTSIIQVTLQVKGADNATINFSDRVNLYLETGGT